MSHWYRRILVCAALAAGLDPRPAVAQGAPTSPLTIEEVLRRALARHPLVEASEGRVTAAGGNRRAAGAFTNPLLTYQAENGSFLGEARPPGVTTETSIFATFAIEDWYQRWPRMRQANEELRAAESDLVSTRRRVALDAARAFYRLALAQANLDAALEVQRQLDALTRYSESRVAEGVTAEGDLLRIQVEAERAASTTTLAEVELARARADLTPFLGDARGPSPDSVWVATADSIPAADSLAPLAAFAARAVEDRPELRAARARAAAARAGVGIQRSLLLRQVGLVFGTKRLSGFNTLIAGVTLPVPIFNQNGGGRATAAGERATAVAELEWSERQARADIEAAYRAADLLTRRVARLRQGFLSRADEFRRITLAAYEEGGASLLQVLDASRAWADARVIYYQTVFAQRQSLLELHVAAGQDPVPGRTTLGTAATSPTSQIGASR